MALVCLFFWPTVQILLYPPLFFLIWCISLTSPPEDKFPLFHYIAIAFGLLVYSWIIAKIKAKETNNKAFIPALFFMVVITTVEWVPGLQAEGTDYVWLMIVPLLYMQYVTNYRNCIG